MMHFLRNLIGSRCLNIKGRGGLSTQKECGIISQVKPFHRPPSSDHQTSDSDPLKRISRLKSRSWPKIPSCNVRCIWNRSGFLFSQLRWLERRLICRIERFRLGSNGLLRPQESSFDDLKFCSFCLSDNHGFQISLNKWEIVNCSKPVF